MKHEFHKLNIKYENIKIKDCINDENIQNLIKWIHNCLSENENENKNRILIHCMEGIAESATIVIAYLMKKNKRSFNVAFEYLQTIRPSICLNHALKQLLLQFEKQIII